MCPILFFRQNFLNLAKNFLTWRQSVEKMILMYSTSKKYYSLLEIKDYLLSKKLVEKCGKAKKPVFIIYFYSNQGDCPDCGREGYVLTRLKEIYPDLRVYSFDYHLDLSVIDSMKKIYKVDNVLPALVIEDKTYTGFKSIEELTDLLPNTLKTATSSISSATSSKKR
jgi:hypothetical protein